LLTFVADHHLCCLVTEFSENMGLVADVYISTRRLEGIYFDLASTMDRIRKIAKARAIFLLTIVRLLCPMCHKWHGAANSCQVSTCKTIIVQQRGLDARIPDAI
jgi:hypothetical protein